ncbi:hypothetical protein SCALM49S_03234 [Streptomyces californicus]
MTTLSSGFARARRWLRGHPLAFDAALAFGTLAAMICGSFAARATVAPAFGARTPELFSVLLMTLSAAALVLRRRRPMQVLAVTGALSVVEYVLMEPPARSSWARSTPSTPSPRAPTAPPPGGSAC